MKDPAGTGEQGHKALDAFHRMCLESDLTVKMPPSTPIYIAELFETLNVAIEIDPRMPEYRERSSGKHRQSYL